MVFQTAPPQPASKARMICSPQLVGGAEASQKGFGPLILPAKPRTRISGIGGLRDLQDGASSTFAVGDSVYNLAAAVGTIAAGKVAGIAGLAGFRIGDNDAVAHLDAAKFLHELRE